MEIKLIIGLGNPDEKYQLNRHNIGFWLVDLLAEKFNSAWKLENKFFAYTSSINIADNKIILAKPITYMNNSGKSSLAICNFFKININNTLVCHDELDIDIDNIKLKFGGGHGGHNGLRDIINRQNKDFYRLRIGIGRPEFSDVSSFVLSNPGKKEAEIILSNINKVVDNIEKVISNPDDAMQIINTKG